MSGDVHVRICERLGVRLPRATRPILGFQFQTDADRFLENLRERLAKFGLELHPDKTRRIEFGRFAEENRKRRGEGKPETFDFLGFTHISGKNSLGRFMVRRKTIRKRIRGKLRKIKQQLRMRMHDPLPQTGRWLQSVVQGHFNYYAVPGNLASLGAFRDRVLALWWRTLRARFIPFRMHALPPFICDKNRMR
jgi:RNA-directed DNA polymerase